MTTRRESYVAALMSLLEADPGLQALGTTLKRSIAEAIDSGESPALVVHRGRDVVADSNIGRTTRSCALMLTAVVRDPAPDRAADELFEFAHPILMHFDADGLVGVNEETTDEPETAEIEGGVGVVTLHYTVLYQTNTDSLIA